MGIRKLPDITPQTVVELQDALLANADALLQSAFAVLDLGNPALARSLAILGIEESAKAIAIHERRVAMARLPEGTQFRCDELDALWGSHEKKLKLVHRFLVNEQYWFGTQPSDADENAAVLGSVRRWSERHDTAKQRGFYVDLDRGGRVLSPPNVSNEGELREVINRVHQIGWQLRLGEHIEGKQQDQRERGTPPATEAEIQATVTLLSGLENSQDFDDAEYLESLRTGVPGHSPNNAAYRFNPPGAGRSPFRNLGRPGYEAETREVMGLASRLEMSEKEEC